MNEEDIFRLQFAYQKARTAYEAADEILERMGWKFERLSKELRKTQSGPCDAIRMVSNSGYKDDALAFPTMEEVNTARDQMYLATKAMWEAWSAIPDEHHSDSKDLPKSFSRHNWSPRY